MMIIINMGEWGINVLSIMIVGTVILVLIQHILEGFELNNVIHVDFQHKKQIDIMFDELDKLAEEINELLRDIESKRISFRLICWL